MSRITRSVRGLALVAGVVLFGGFACAASEPGPSIAGTWHLSVGPLDSGTVSPTAFDVVVTPSADSFLVTMPALTWSGGLVFDIQQTLIVFGNGTSAGFGAKPTNPSDPCEGVFLFGTLNPGRDTLYNAQVQIADTSTVSGPNTVCLTRWSGSLTAHK